MLNLEGKWALVTGASRGIGKLAAEALAAKGCNLILLSRDTAHTAAFAKTLSEKVCVKETACDLADPASVSQAQRSGRVCCGSGDRRHGRSGRCDPQ